MLRLGLYSFGGGSWNAARVSMREHPGDEHKLLYTDTLYENADTYRFGLEGACWLYGRDPSWIPRAEEFPSFMVEGDFDIRDYAGNPAWRAFLADLRAVASKKLPELIWLVEGRDIWEIFRDERLLGNTQRDPCSKKLKRKVREKWLKANCDPAETIVYIGIGEDEKHRFESVDKSGKRTGFLPSMEKEGWLAEAPLIGRIEGMVSSTLYIKNAGLEPSFAYGQGHAHDNCSQTCCKQGEAAIIHNYRTDPIRARYEAMMERKIIEYLAKPYPIAMYGRQQPDVNGVAQPKVPETREQLFAKADANPQQELIFIAADGGHGCGCAL